MDGPGCRGYGTRSGYDVRTRRLRGGPELTATYTPLKIEIPFVVRFCQVAIRAYNCQRARAPFRDAGLGRRFEI